MTDFSEFSVAQAAVRDPQTSAADLATLAAAQRGLWADIAAHPNAYPALLNWLQARGGEDVRTAIANRAATTSAPVVPPVQPAPLAPVAPAAPLAWVTPTAPFTPITPADPVAPASPITAAVPTALIAPTVPVTPVAPLTPVAPATPAPAAPVSPAAPLAEAPIVHQPATAEELLDAFLAQSPASPLLSERPAPLDPSTLPTPFPPSESSFGLRDDLYPQSTVPRENAPTPVAAPTPVTPTTPAIPPTPVIPTTYPSSAPETPAVATSTAVVPPTPAAFTAPASPTPASPTEVQFEEQPTEESHADAPTPTFVTTQPPTWDVPRTPVAPTPPPKKSKKGPIFAIIGVLVLAVGVFGGGMWMGWWGVGPSKNVTSDEFTTLATQVLPQRQGFDALAINAPAKLTCSSQDNTFEHTLATADPDATKQGVSMRLYDSHESALLYANQTQACWEENGNTITDFSKTRSWGGLTMYDMTFSRPDKTDEVHFAVYRNVFVFTNIPDRYEPWAAWAKDVFVPAVDEASPPE